MTSFYRALSVLRGGFGTSSAPIISGFSLVVLSAFFFPFPLLLFRWQCRAKAWKLWLFLATVLWLQPLNAPALGQGEKKQTHRTHNNHTDYIRSLCEQRESTHCSMESAIVKHELNSWTSPVTLNRNYCDLQTAFHKMQTRIHTICAGSKDQVTAKSV